MIKLFYEGEKFRRAKYYKEGMVCIAPQVAGRTVGEIEHMDFNICFNKTDAAYITGGYRRRYRMDGGRMADTTCRYSALLQYLEKTIKLTALHITEEQGMVFCLTDVMERTYFLPQADVLYLESGHNRVFWHTGNGVVEVTGTLLGTEGGLPAPFLRIHRSYIVNSMHVEKIDRCYVELTNGECLQIPVKKYTGVRDKLLLFSSAAYGQFVENVL